MRFLTWYRHHHYEYMCLTVGTFQCLERTLRCFHFYKQHDLSWRTGLSSQHKGAFFSQMEFRHSFIIFMLWGWMCPYYCGDLIAWLWDLNEMHVMLTFNLRSLLLSEQGSRQFLREVLRQSQMLVCVRTVSLSFSKEISDGGFLAIVIFIISHVS